jgi:hypothetical protein
MSHGRPCGGSQPCVGRNTRNKSAAPRWTQPSPRGDARRAHAASREVAARWVRRAQRPRAANETCRNGSMTAAVMHQGAPTEPLPPGSWQCVVHAARRPVTDSSANNPQTPDGAIRGCLGQRARAGH